MSPRHKNPLPPVVPVHVCVILVSQPTRSLGDAYLKYSEFNGQAGVHSSAGRFLPPPYTPPYITAEPEVRTCSVLAPPVETRHCATRALSGVCLTGIAAVSPEMTRRFTSTRLTRLRMNS